MPSLKFLRHQLSALKWKEDPQFLQTFAMLSNFNFNWIFFSYFTKRKFFSGYSSMLCFTHFSTVFTFPHGNIFKDYFFLISTNINFACSLQAIKSNLVRFSFPAQFFTFHKLQAINFPGWHLFFRTFLEFSQNHKIRE